MIVKQNKNIEKEVKFKIDSKLAKSQLEDFLKKLGLVAKEQIFQKDVYWDNRTCDIINLKRGLRIRYISNKIKDVEFKSLFNKMNGQYVVEEIKLFKENMLDVSALKEILVTRLEICELKDFDNDNSNSPEIYLSKLGLKPVVILEKERSLWVDKNNEIEVSVDIVTDLGTFVEIEQVDNSNRIYDEIVKKFEESIFATQDSTHGGYLDFILNKNSKITSKSEFENKFVKDSMWNVKPNEKNIFLSLTYSNV